MEVSQAIKMERAVREFTDELIPEAQLEAVVNAGRRAQSSKNTRPWHFIVVRDRKILAELSKLGRYSKQLAEAAAAIVIVTPDPAERWSIMLDAGQAAGYMQLAAWDQGIGSCPVTIYKPNQARELLGFPLEFHVRAVISLGYPKDPDSLTASPHAGGRKEVVCSRLLGPLRKSGPVGGKMNVKGSPRRSGRRPSGPTSFRATVDPPVGSARSGPPGSECGSCIRLADSQHWACLPQE